MVETLKRTETYFIPAGTVMVYMMDCKPYLMFQLLSKLVISDSLTETSLVGYEPGSVVHYGSSKFMPTLKFKYCRFPLSYEYRKYMQSKTI